MDILQFAEEVIGVRMIADNALDLDNLPKALSTLHLLNSTFSESILETDVRILEPKAMYDVGEYRIFAEEAQCVSWWAFVEPRDDSDCFVITHKKPVKAFREDFRFSEVLLAMVVKNTLSSELLPHYRYSKFPGRHLEALTRKVSVVGGFLNGKAIVFGGVSCFMEVGEELFISAASRSSKELASFFSLVESTLGRELPE